MQSSSSAGLDSVVNFMVETRAYSTEMSRGASFEVPRALSSITAWYAYPRLLEDYLEQENDEEDVPRMISHQKTNLPWVYSLVFLGLIAAAGFSVLLPSMWPRLQSLGESKQFLGYVVASYCVGQIIGSILQGWCTGFIESKSILVSSLVIESAGYLVYVAFDNRVMIILSRVISGFGAGNVAVARALIALYTPDTQRTSVLSLFNSSQAIGFVIGPVIAFSLSSVDTTIFLFGGSIHLNSWTAPAVFSSIVGALNIAMIVYTVPKSNDIPNSESPPHTVMQQRENEGNVESMPIRQEKYVNQKVDSNILSKKDEIVRPLLAEDEQRGSSKISSHSLNHRYSPESICCIFVYFILYIVFSLFETVVTPLTEEYYKWKVKQNSVVFICISVQAAITLTILRKLSKVVSDKSLFTLGILVMISGCALLSTWGTVGKGESLPKWRLVGGLLLLLGIGYSSSMTTVLSIFSKSIPRESQGTMMGWIGASGSLGRIVGPVLATQTLVLVNPNNINDGVFALFTSGLIILLVSSTILLCILRKK